jgi:hypothetical protein
MGGDLKSLNNRRQREDGKVFVSLAARCSVKTAGEKSLEKLI